MASFLALLAALFAAVSAHPYYHQPTSAVDEVLGKKCFAWSTLNALRESGQMNANAFANNDAAGDWIRANFQYDDGGAPMRVVTALRSGPNARIAAGTTTRIFTTVTQQMRGRIATALGRPLGVAVGIGKINDANKKHWVYATGTTGTTIVTYDQQGTNGQRTFTWDTAHGGRWKTGTGNNAWKITQVSFIGPGNLVQALPAAHMGYGDYYDDDQQGYMMMGDEDEYYDDDDYYEGYEDEGYYYDDYALYDEALMNLQRAQKQFKMAKALLRGNERAQRQYNY